MAPEWWLSEMITPFLSPPAKQKKTNKLIELFGNYGLIEFVRSARVAYH